MFQFLNIIKEIKSKDSKKKLNVVLERAKQIKLKNGNDGLHDYIRALLYPSMYMHLYECLTAHDHNAPPPLNYIDLFPGNEFQLHLNEVAQSESQYQVNLGKDIIFTTPWNPQRIVSHIGYISHKVPFKEDTTNHHIVTYIPLQISIVSSGNHSIMQGILNKDGIVHPEYVYNLSNELKRYSYTGTHWFDNVTKEEIPVHNHDIGLAWEVSKLLV